MKTRRIFLQPGEPVEIINQFGTSILKVTAAFSYTSPCAVIYEQPGVFTYTPDDARDSELTDEPVSPPSSPQISFPFQGTDV